MKTPSFDYESNDFSAGRMAYDLALAYAKSKLDNALRTEKDFSSAHVYTEINEIEYLSSHFLYALDYLNGTEPGEIEDEMARFSEGGHPFLRDPE